MAIFLCICGVLGAVLVGFLLWDRRQHNKVNRDWRKSAFRD